MILLADGREDEGESVKMCGHAHMWWNLINTRSNLIIPSEFLLWMVSKINSRFIQLQFFRLALHWPIVFSECIGRPNSLLKTVVDERGESVPGTRMFG